MPKPKKIRAGKLVNRIDEALAEGKQFRKAIRRLSASPVDDEFIQGLEARLSFDLVLLKKERHRISKAVKSKEDLSPSEVPKIATITAASSETLTAVAGAVSAASKRIRPGKLKKLPVDVDAPETGPKSDT